MNNTSHFTKNISELATHFSARKDNIVRYLKKHFREHIHYICVKNVQKNQHGGLNKQDYLLTTTTFDLIINSFNLKHEYVRRVNNNCGFVNIIMSLENQTIGFIENSFRGVIKTEREKIIAPYKVDLYFSDYKLVVECDEFGHSDRCVEHEKKREEYLLAMGWEGVNRECISLTVNTFKKFCLKAGTKKADEVHDYYIRLETLIQETLNEETAELKDQLQKKDEVIMNKIEQFQKLQYNHERLLYKRSKHQVRKGKCFYITRQNDVHNKYKFGITNDLNSRISAYRTYDITDFLYIAFTDDNRLLEDCVKRKFRTFLTRYNSEWVCNIELDDIISFVASMISVLELESSQYTNRNEIIVQEEAETPIPNHTDRIAAFNRDRSKVGGFHTTCRLCEKECKKKYMDQKRDILEKITEKECHTVRDISYFTKHLYMRDGCVQENSNAKRKLDRENNIRYQCGRCGSTYARKDTLAKHQSACV